MKVFLVFGLFFVSTLAQALEPTGSTSTTSPPYAGQEMEFDLVR